MMKYQHLGVLNLILGRNLITKHWMGIVHDIVNQCFGIVQHIYSDMAFFRLLYVDKISLYEESGIFSATVQHKKIESRNVWSTIFQNMD